MAELRARVGRTRPPARTGIVHLGLGAFHRAHQAAYTQAVDAERRWGIAAFTGRAQVPAALAEQDGVYTLVVAGEHARATVIDQLSTLSSGRDLPAFRAAVAAPDVSVITLTVTEAGYLLGEDGRVDLVSEEARGDIASLRAGADPSSAPGRLVDALAARRRGGRPLTVLSCDNLTGNGDLLREAVAGIAAEVDPSLAAWIEREVVFPRTVVDRITPASTEDTQRLAGDLTGLDDRAAVLTEAHSEWIIEDRFVTDRPAWERAGVVLAADVAPFAARKLRLLNAAHTLLALEGTLRGHETVHAAFADPVLRAAVEELWDAVARALPDAGPLDDYRRALAARFADAAVPHRLAQIAAGSAEKIRVRIVPTVEAETRAGRDGAEGLRVVAAFLASADETDLASAVARIHGPWARDDRVLTTLRAEATRLGRLPVPRR
jgi:fructuronate reductase